MCILPRRRGGTDFVANPVHFRFAPEEIHPRPVEDHSPRAVPCGIFFAFASPGRPIESDCGQEIQSPERVPFRGRAAERQSRGAKRRPARAGRNPKCMPRPVCVSPYPGSVRVIRRFAEAAPRLRAWRKEIRVRMNVIEGSARIVPVVLPAPLAAQSLPAAKRPARRRIASPLAVSAQTPNLHQRGFP